MVSFDSSGFVSFGMSRAPASVFIVLGTVIALVVALLYFATGIGSETMGTVIHRVIIAAAQAEPGEMVLVHSADSPNL